LEGSKKDEKNLKRTINPYDSKIMPVTGHPIRTRRKPIPNDMVPCQIKKIIEGRKQKQIRIIYSNCRISIRF
jgi:hypothetical protein